MGSPGYAELTNHMNSLATLMGFPYKSSGITFNDILLNYICLNQLRKDLQMEIVVIKKIKKNYYLIITN